MAGKPKRIPASATRTRIVVDLDLGDIRRLQALADEAERSRAQQIRLAVREHLERHSKARS